MLTCQSRWFVSIRMSLAQFQFSRNLESPLSVKWRDVTPYRPGASAVCHLVKGVERCKDAALVCLHNVSVLDHLVQDDVDSVQVEHDLMMRSKKQKHTPDIMLTERGSDGRIRPVRSVGTHTQTQWSDRTLKLNLWLRVMSCWTHHPAEVFIQNFYEVVNQLIDGQLILWRHSTDTQHRHTLFNFAASLPGHSWYCSSKFPP